jgi:RHS repeat-associated protein
MTYSWHLYYPKYITYTGVSSYNYKYDQLYRINIAHKKNSQINYDYGFRIYNAGIGKFLRVDPLTQAYPELTPYQFASNTPIAAIDIDGLERYFAADGSYLGRSGKSTEIRIIGNDEIAKVAKVNLASQKNDHKWLLEKSVTTYKKNTASEKQLLSDWAIVYKNKSVEHTMTLFSITLNENGIHFSILIINVHLK